MCVGGGVCIALRGKDIVCVCVCVEGVDLYVCISQADQ